MLVEAGVALDFEYTGEALITNRLPNLFHINFSSLLQFLLNYIEGAQVESEEEKLMLTMVYYTFYKSHPEKEGYSSIEEGVQELFVHPLFKQEIKEIVQYLYYSMQTMELEHDFDFACPLRVHSKYSTSQVLAALGYFNETANPSFREGVKYFKEKDIDIFFITLNKSEKDFSPSTLYDDYAINERLFHWQPQSQVSEGSSTGERYIHHRKRNHQIALFVREYKKDNRYTAPFVFLGTADYVKHEGNRPMNFIWRLREEMPAYLVPKANKNVL